MHCPFGYDDHEATWRCFVLYFINWLSLKIPESWPIWCYKPLNKLIILIEVEK